MIFTGPRGHLSASDDYCEVCGTKNQDAVQALFSGQARASAGQQCPTCATPREGIDRYCPGCAYDFETGDSLLPPAGPAPAFSTGLIVVLSVDANRSNEDGCPRPPVDRSEHVFMIDRSAAIIGRDDVSDLQIPIHGDPYVSRRHGEIMNLGDGWGIRDLGSTNGTRLNGVALVGSEVRRLMPEDILELGCFSRLTVRAALPRGVK
jgi:hypothetical protein